MDSAADPPCGGGCPIRRSLDQSLLAAPQGFSQRATSFIASWRQGIHQMPLLSSTPASHHHRPTPHDLRSCGDPARRRTAPTKREQVRGGDRRRRSPATTTKGRPCEERPAYPCQMRALPTDGRDQEEGQNARLADARHARRMEDRSPMPATGTSSPPHDVQTAKACHASPQRGGRERLVGLGRLERPTSRLSGVRSNQLSYRPKIRRSEITRQRSDLSLRPRPDGCWRRDVQTAT